MPLYEMVKGAYYFYILDLKDKISNKDAKIKEEVVEKRAPFLASKCWLFRKIIMPKLITH